MSAAKVYSFTREQLEHPTPEQRADLDELTRLLGKEYRAAQSENRAPTYQIRATFVVQRTDGTIKYDRPELAGTYGEEHLHG